MITARGRNGEFTIRRTKVEMAEWGHPFVNIYSRTKGKNAPISFNSHVDILIQYFQGIVDQLKEAKAKQTGES
jgi:hypothetical protein